MVSRGWEYDMTTEPTPILDDLARMQSVDKRSMLRLINELPEQFETAMGIARNLAVEPVEEKPSSILITGSDDSGVIVDMATTVLAEEIDIPVIRGYGERLPKFVGEGTLVFTVDYSGKSASALRNYKEAKSRGAKIIVITSGSKLLEAASADGAVIAKILPGQPRRTAIGYLLAPIVIAVEKMGLTEGLSERLSHAVKHLKNVREAFRFETSINRNAAKQIAQALYEKMIFVYGAAGYRAVVATRWKSQFSTNSKVLAAKGTFPGVADGDIAGWELSARQGERFGIVFLKDSSDKTDTGALMNAAKSVLSQFEPIDVEMKGATTLEKLLYGLYLGDYASYYLAMLYEINPTSTDYVTKLEETLSGGTE